MRPRRALTAVVLATAVLWYGAVLAQSTLESCNPALIPPNVAGQVVKVNLEKGKVTVQGSDGTMHEFQASKETLQTLKEGEHITAKFRTPSHCSSSEVK